MTPTQYTIIEPSDSPKPVGIGSSNTVLPLPFYMNEHSWDGKGPHKHIDICYLLKSKTDKITDNPDGASDIGWFDLSEIEEIYKKGDLYEDTLVISKWIFDNKV